jgi:uncharacterized protein (DUF2147 family)
MPPHGALDSTFFFCPNRASDVGGKMNFRIVGALCASVLFVAMAFGSAAADPKGLWLANDGAHVLVSSCGKALCGTLATTNPPLDPATGQPWKDKSNPDPDRRSHPLVGLQIFIAMTQNGPGRWSGHLYNADDGHTYEGNIIEVDGRTIRVEGCAAPGACGGQSMTRIK